MSAEDIPFQLRQLGSVDARERVRMLYSIAARPDPEPSILLACEKLLGDREICLLSIPYRFGEVRFVAAEAVSALRESLGIHVPVKLEGTFTPCTSDDVARLARAADVPMLGGVSGTVEALKRLVEMRCVPLRTINR